MTRAYSQAFELARNGISASLCYSLAGATLLVVLSFATAYNVERHRAQYLDLLLLLVFAVPSTVLGIGLIRLWNQGVFSRVVYNTALIVVIAYLARFLVLTERMFISTLKQIPVSFEEAARIEGASTFQLWTKIVLPITGATIVTAWLIAFIFCFGELGTTIIVYPAGGATLPIRLYTIMANSPENIVSALSMFLVFPSIVIIFISLFSVKSVFRRL